MTIQTALFTDDVHVFMKNEKKNISPLNELLLAFA